MPKAIDMKCYYGCKIDGPLHRFPKWIPNTEKFNQWKSILNVETQVRGNDYIYNAVRLCYRHFKENFRLPSKRLTVNAIPTLNLTSPQSTQENKEPIEQFLVADPNGSATENCSIQSSNCSDEPDVATSGCDEPDIDISSSSQHLEDGPVSVLHLSIVPKKRCLKQGSSFIIMKMTEKLKNMRQKCKLQSMKIRSAKKLAMSKTLEKLPKASQTFIRLQLKYTNSPRGRRYTKEEKEMALTILKQSTKAYEILQKMFVLPSLRSLQKLGV